MEVVQANLALSRSSDRSRWSAYVDRSPESTYYHTLPWLDAITATFHHRPRHLLAQIGREPVGLLPLFEVSSFLAGKILVSVPYAVYGGILADNDDVSEALFKKVQRLADALGVRYVDIRSIRSRWPDVPTVRRYAHFVKSLPEKKEQVIHTLPRKARAEARKALDRYRLRERFDEGQLKDVWRLYSQSMRRLGSPNMPWTFFEAIVRSSPTGHVVSTIMYKNRPICGLLSLIHKGTIMPYYSGCEDKVARGRGANNALYLSLMEKAVEMGMTRFDFGRTRYDNTGSFEFKKNQGFEPASLEYQYYMPDCNSVPNLTPSNRKFQLAQWVWKRLPLTVTRPVGSWLSSAIPG